MLILLSPAKNLNEARAAGRATTTPRFLEEAGDLVAVARNWTESDIAALMKVSPAIASLNVDRFAKWSSATGPAQAAGDMFDGDAYKHLEMATLDDAARAEAGQRLRLLSGLYGLLRPSDAVRAYRLEMGRKLPGHPAGTLYNFWNGKIAAALAEDAANVGTDTILNLASDEYAKAVDRTALAGLRMIAPRFEEERRGLRRMISVSAKRARGMMARWVLENGVTDPADLPGFDTGGYAFDPEASTPERPVFLRA
ncbi:MAG: YaaA family protein [Rhodobacterales bacterium]|nr:YaaA family protein [Rhodobacterales bacterium]